MTELWAPVDGFNLRYEVSSFGRMRRTSFVDRRGVLHVTRVLTPSRGCKYWAIYIAVDGRKFGILVHRAMAKAFIPNPLNLPEVNHIDGDKLNNELTNLEWVTTKQNARHARVTGLIKQKLDEAAVRDIRARYRWRSGTNALASEYGITKEQVRNVVTGKHFPWIK